MKLELYNDEHIYKFTDGTIATPERMLSEYPLIKHFPHVIETNDNSVCYKAINIYALMRIYNIPYETLIEDAVVQLNALQINPTDEELLTATADFISWYETRQEEGE